MRIGPLPRPVLPRPVLPRFTLPRLTLAAALAAGLALAPGTPLGPRPAPAQAAPAEAPAQATLVSDRLEITGDNRLIAEGAVDIFYKGARLTAQRVVFDRTADTLAIEGPIRLTEADGRAVLVADQADLSADLTEGILRSARMVLDRQLQIASNRLMRTAGGRYTALDRAVASSCRVCEDSPVPVWEIRARRIIHDREERQLYFDHATFRVAGVPVLYLPRLRMPDPGLKRARGFLMPSAQSTSLLGFGVKVPYFIPIGPHRDLTLTPFLTTKGGANLFLRYRQAFRTGQIEFNGGLARDPIRPDQLRGYGVVTGDFRLPADFALRLKLQGVSDEGYLLDYGLSEADRLDSRVEISRVRRTEMLEARALHVNSLRVEDSVNSTPALLTDVTWDRRFVPPVVGGQASLRLQSHSHLRTSTSGVDAPGVDGDRVADGRDVARASLRADWRRSFVLPMGIEAALVAEAAADAYAVGDDDVHSGRTTRLHGAAGVELRWPWIAAAATGATHVIEPVVQLVASPGGTEALYNEDSTLVDLDETSLFALNRFPGTDAVERGARANLGLGWTRIDPAGWTLGLSLGRVLRAADPGQFSAASGLDGQRSDWLVGGQLGLADGTLVTARSLIGESGEVTRGEMRVDLARARLDLSGALVWARADEAEDRAIDTREVSFASRYRFNGNWTGKATGRYDLAAERGTLAGFGVEYRTECVLVDFSLSRRFTSSSSVAASTDFGLSVDLIGFGGANVPGPARQCRG
jgi:LPS-assembly protein